MDCLVFLDIDGVVNTLQLDDKPFDTPRGKIQRHDKYYFDLCSPSDGRVSNRQAIMWLNMLCLEFHAKIIISSTWRSHLEQTKQALYNSGLFPEIPIIGATPILPSRIRGQEILTYLQYNCTPRTYKFVILDDDSDMEGCMDHLVLCNTHHGFGYPEYYKAAEIFAKE